MEIPAVEMWMDRMSPTVLGDFPFAHALGKFTKYTVVKKEIDIGRLERYLKVFKIR